MSRLHDPYFRAMLTHVVLGDWNDILDEEVIPFWERLSIAFQFLDNRALSSVTWTHSSSWASPQLASKSSRRTWTAVVSSLISALYPISVPGKGCNANNNFQEGTSEMISKHHLPLNTLSNADQPFRTKLRREAPRIVKVVIDERCEVHEVLIGIV